MDADEPLSDDEIRALFEPLLGAPMAVAVSGGADSMALMHIAQRALELVPPQLKSMASPGRPRLKRHGRPLSRRRCGATAVVPTAA